MTATKTKISVSISSELAHFLAESADAQSTSKSALVEDAIQKMIHERMAIDAKKIANATFDDLPSEDEWLELQLETDNL